MVTAVLSTSASSAACLTIPQGSINHFLVDRSRKRPTVNRPGFFQLYFYRIVLCFNDAWNAFCENTLPFPCVITAGAFAEEWYAEVLTIRQIGRVVNTLEESAWLVLLISGGERTDASSAGRVSITPSPSLSLSSSFLACSSITFMKVADKYTTENLLLFVLRASALYPHKCRFSCVVIGTVNVCIKKCFKHKYFRSKFSDKSLGKLLREAITMLKLFNIQH